MTDAEREYELEQAVRLLGEHMRNLRRSGFWPDPSPEEREWIEDQRRNVAEGKRKVAELLARDPEIAGDYADPENTALR